MKRSARVALLFVLAGCTAFAGSLSVSATPAPASTPAPVQPQDATPSLRAEGADSPQRRLPGSRRWLLQKPATGRQIEGYPTQSSARAGQRVGLKVSTSARTFRVRAYRLGAYRGGTGRLIWQSRAVTGKRRSGAVFERRSTRTVVAPWGRSLTVPTRGWPAGAYVFKLTASTGWQAHVPFFVRSRTAKGKVALVAPITTWQAYNDWGGYSLYRGASGDRRAWAVSFDRPYPAPGAGEMMHGVVPVVIRAERLGIALAYFTNTDIAARPRALSGARGYVSMGHDEYWSLPMRRNVLRARAAGTNLAFLGANTMYWRIRLENRRTGPRRVVVGYRSDAHLDPMRRTHPDRVTGRFPRPARPEAGELARRDEVRVFPGRPALPRGLTRVVGIPRHPREARRGVRAPRGRRGRPGLSGRLHSAAPADPVACPVQLPRRRHLGAVRVLHDPIRVGGLRSRHAEMDLRGSRVLS